MRRSIKKPCPGCGKTGCYRLVDRACDECIHKIQLHDQALLATVAAKDREGTVLVSMPEFEHWIPGFYFGERAHSKEVRELRDWLRRHFWEFGMSLTSGPQLSWEEIRDVVARDEHRVFERPQIRNQGGGDALYPDYPTAGGESGRVYFVMRKDRFTAINRLFDSVARMIHAAYVTGLDEGHDALMQLSTGSITIEKMNEENMRIAAKVQSVSTMQRAIAKPGRASR